MADRDEDPTVRAVLPAARDEFTAMLCGDQRLRWMQGNRFPVEAFIEQFPELKARPAAIQALIRGEIQLRRELGEPLEIAEYQKRFPDHSDWLLDAVKKIDAPSVSTAHSEHEDVDDAQTPWPSVPGYEIIEEIGRGGMGIVYKAHQIEPSRFVALKVLRHGSQASARARQRFRDEADAVRRLQHPNIAHVYEILEQGDQLCFSMEFVSGESLSKKIHGEPQPILWSVQIVQMLAHAVQYAHECQTIHRDLKPSNILITPEGIPKIVDFGLAKRIDADTSLTKTGTVLGTPDYMSPEQAEGRIREIAPATDIYALGVILYELLTGRTPFRGTTLIRVLDAVRFQQPESLRSIRPEVPPELEAICMKCLEKSPGKRYTLAVDLLNALGSVAEQLTNPRSSVSLWQKIRKRLRLPLG